MRMLKSLRRLIGRGEADLPVTPARQRLDLGQANPLFPVYAIGDVHGCLDLLKDAEDSIHSDVLANEGHGLIVMLGDYIDRGPASAAVLDHLLRPPPPSLLRITLCGNHEDAFLGFLRTPRANSHWLRHGGDKTLLSYGIDIAHFTDRRGIDERRLVDALSGAIPPAHLAFLENLPVSLRLGACLYVHAGVRPGVSLEDQTDTDMLWIREPFLSQGHQMPLVVVHGHTPVAAPESGPRRICIDTSAVTTGRLTVLKLSGCKARVLPSRAAKRA